MPRRPPPKRPSSPKTARTHNRTRPAARQKPARASHLGSIPFGGALILDRYELRNGLRVLMLVDRSAPVVSYQTWFRVGSRHEKPGKTGLAHLFEHLMFNETSHLAAGEFDRTLEAAGGETNAATWVDWTFYYENVPSSELGLVVRLEADRMGHLVLREPQVVSEKEVVANERRYRVEDDVEGAVNERLYALAFKEHPYHWPTIGWMQDIEGFTTADCEAFYRTYYAPNNATVVIVGDVDADAALALLDHHYGYLRRAELPKETPVVEPRQRAERTCVMRRATPTEKLQLGYKSPAFEDPDHAILTVTNELLFGGRSSRLYRQLVSEGELATEARASLSPFRDTGLYEVWVSMRPGVAADAALDVIEAEFALLAKEPVKEAELEKVRNRLELSFLQGMETASGKAEQIGFYETSAGDAAKLFSRLEQYKHVTASDVQRAAQTYFETSRRTKITVLPEESAS